MRRVYPVLFAGLMVVAATAPAGKPGCSCGTSAPVAVAPTPVVQPGVNDQSAGVRRPSPAPIAVEAPPPTVEPMTFTDDTTGVVFHFEKDGQHVSAVDTAGKELWRVNPLDTANLKGREFNGKKVWPMIVYAGPPQMWMVNVATNRGKKSEFIALGMNTKEGGLLDVRTGEFLSTGND